MVFGPWAHVGPFGNKVALVRRVLKSSDGRSKGHECVKGFIERLFEMNQIIVIPFEPTLVVITSSPAVTSKPANAVSSPARRNAAGLPGFLSAIGIGGYFVGSDGIIESHGSFIRLSLRTFAAAMKVLVHSPFGATHIVRLLFFTIIF